MKYFETIEVEGFFLFVCLFSYFFLFISGQNGEKDFENIGSIWFWVSTCTLVWFFLIWREMFKVKDLPYYMKLLLNKIC